MITGGWIWIWIYRAPKPNAVGRAGEEKSPRRARVVPRGRDGGEIGARRVRFIRGVGGRGRDVAFTLLSPGRQEVAGARASVSSRDETPGRALCQNARAPGQLIASRGRPSPSVVSHLPSPLARVGPRWIDTENGKPSGVEGTRGLVRITPCHAAVG